VACARWPNRSVAGSGRSPVPQVCPHLVNVAAPLWKQPVETLTRDRQRPDHRRSEAISGPAGGSAGVAAGKGRGERGETRRGPNIAPLSVPRQGAIHRFRKAGGRSPRRVGCLVDFHIPIRVVRPAAPARADDLTSRFAPAYRFSVTRCRRVPHVHVIPPSRPAVADVGEAECVGGRCRPKPWTSRSVSFDQLRPTRSGDLAEAPA
jgi:hypothetical protein